ncbi:hypothetical protein D8674_020625 [Pyrus ussuriensis x Pyrus communis]|uniref:Uncharacterized protein n=1 Tax=Pyrus ussuriensis x Pyrus communis TaxID=2448454 RepID=A0A5N5HJL1_9ROSA|nr:hypothetical protein D8674_020625 [Pyrus ussuriensis x Pyrus communis]
MTFGVLVWTNYFAESASFKMVLEELKKYMVQELSDIDETNPKLLQFIDNIFKGHFWEWKYDVERDAKLHRNPKRIAE